MPAALFRSTLVALLLGWRLDATAAAQIEQNRPLSFNRDVRPILAENCFQCHGPDKGARKAGLRLDQQETALTGGKSGEKAIIPGRPNEGEVIRRITTEDPDDVMPPPKTGKRLTAAQVATLRKWIADGARWEGHWAFQKPVLPPIPEIRSSTVRNPIDSFVQARLQSAKLKPSPEADRRTLIRRLSLDLTGLPPTPEEVEAFALDSRPGAYEELVERVLASPHFGERWGRHWLDLARYADSDGYEKDAPRPTAWIYRDWVMAAINRDLPFDQFTVEQLAGDLLPNATAQQ